MLCLSLNSLQPNAQADFVRNLDKQFQASRNNEQGLARGLSGHFAAKDAQTRAATGARASTSDSPVASVSTSLDAHIFCFAEALQHQALKFKFCSSSVLMACMQLGALPAAVCLQLDACIL